MQPDLLARYRVLRVLLTLVTVIVAIFTVQLVWTSLVAFGDIILLFFLAWVIAFILEPLSTYLRRTGLPRAVAVSLIYVALAIVISGVIVLTVPIIGDQVRRLAGELTDAFSPARLSAFSADLTLILQRLGLRQRDASGIVSQVWGQIPAYTASIANQAVSIATNTITSVLTLLFDAFLIIILSFYMMLDGERLLAGIIRRLPPRWSEDARMFRAAVTQIFGGFLRAQLVIALIYSALTWIALVLLGQSNSLPVALICGVLMLLPFLGTFLAVAPPIALVLLQTPSDQLAAKLILLVIALVIAQQITLQIIAPRVFGSIMGVHPLLLFAGLLIGAKVGGVWGAFFAGPVVAIAYSMFEVFYDRYQRSSPLFPDKVPLTEGDDSHSDTDDGPSQSQQRVRPSGAPRPEADAQAVPQTPTAQPMRPSERAAEEPSLLD
ncbi:MAG TPA: AI-2E family transporter [Ktedonobacterales bacterium]|jgi:predicted PurR-regulated permease PerM|nr:AI-2E family transporter [Ktedonobacterales bacterium]